MNPADWVALSIASAFGLLMVPFYPGPGITLLVIAAGTAAFVLIVRSTVRFDGASRKRARSRASSRSAFTRDSF